jgi:hypothetical protein
MKPLTIVSSVDPVESLSPQTIRYRHRLTDPEAPGVMIRTPRTMFNHEPFASMTLPDFLRTAVRIHLSVDGEHPVIS